MAALRELVFLIVPLLRFVSSECFGLPEMFDFLSFCFAICEVGRASDCRRDSYEETEKHKNPNKSHSPSFLQDLKISGI